MNSNKKIARFAGLLYFIMAIIGAFSLLYVPSKLIVPGDATATANNIATSESLFRLGAASGLIYPVIFLVLVLTLYKLFTGVNQTYASLMMVLVVAAVPIGFLNVLNQFAVLQLLGDADYMTVFEPDQLNAAVMFFLDLHSQGIITVEIFWGLWLLPLGLLVLKSGFVPKILGVLLIIACVGYLVDFLTRLLFPDYVATISPIVGASKFGELAIILWLLIKGVKEPQAAAGVGFSNAFALLMGLKTISPKELHQLIESQEVTVIDVNSRQSWVKARVPGALNLDPADYNRGDLPPDKESSLVFYCSNPMCRKAPNAARRAKKMGYSKVKVMSAGISGWLGAKLPTERGE